MSQYLLPIIRVSSVALPKFIKSLLNGKKKFFRFSQGKKTTCSAFKVTLRRLYSNMAYGFSSNGSTYSPLEPSKNQIFVKISLFIVWACDFFALFCARKR